MAHIKFLHIVRNVIIAQFSYVGIAWAYRLWMRRFGPLTRIVVFHDVPNRAWFESMIATLIRETRVLTPEEFVIGARDKNRINTLITFDDGYASWISVASPILEKRKLKALFFINSGLLDAAPSPHASAAFMRKSLQIHPRMPLTWEGAATLLKNGHTIGGHTHSHQNLATLDRGEAFAEIQSDKHALESRLGIVLTEFAYPFGTRAHFTKETEEMVQRAGYVRAYTAISRFVPLDTMGQAHLEKVRGKTKIATETYTSYDEGEICSFNKEISQERLSHCETFRIPRMCIEDDLTPARLSKWLHGGYDLFDMLKQLCVR